MIPARPAMALQRSNSFLLLLWLVFAKFLSVPTFVYVKTMLVLMGGC